MFLYYMHVNTCIHFKIFVEHMQSTYKKIRKPISFISPLKGGDDIFDTKTLTFAFTVSNFSP